MPSVAAERWTFRATVRCERTGKWALLWESDAATTYYTEQPNENWQAYLPPGSLSKFFDFLYLFLVCFVTFPLLLLPSYFLTEIDLSLTLFPPSLPPSLPP